jgi:putative phosphonate metabolism protein
MRAAIFFSPPADHPLTEAAAEWLGRDAFSGEARTQPSVDDFPAEELRDLTASPRRYGFHATLKPPFRLAEGRSLDDVRPAALEFCRGRPQIRIASLKLGRLGPFFALTPDGAAPEVQALADDVVAAFDPFRAPPWPDEIERRQPDALSHRQRENLKRWGYPYVLEDFRFHMTLTGPVPAERQAAMELALSRRFAPFIGKPLAIDALSLFVEAEPPGDFVVETRVEFPGAPEAMDAA